MVYKRSPYKHNAKEYIKPPNPSQKEFSNSYDMRIGEKLPFNPNTINNTINCVGGKEIFISLGEKSSSFIPESIFFLVDKDEKF